MKESELRLALETLLPRFSELELETSHLTRVTFDRIASPETCYRAHLFSETIPDLAQFTIDLEFDEHKQLRRAYLNSKLSGRRQIIS